MITLCSADSAPDPGVLYSKGGFTWFYVDLVDDRGVGATVIWSWGLPFLPGYVGAARKGRPQRPIDRPSVNVVVYGEGREQFYLLSELPPERCEWSDDGRTWRMGDCTFRWSDSPAQRDRPAARTLEATLDLALPTGGRATGELWLSGPLRRTATDQVGSCLPHNEERDAVTDPSCTHLWTPMIAASEGWLKLRTPGGTLRVEGRGYHDRNSAEQPLHDLGIDRWWWGRVALPGRDLILYRLTPSTPGEPPRDFVVELAADGSCRTAENTGVQVSGMRRSAWGLRWPTTSTFTDPDGRPVHLEVSALVDNGPFYQRYLLRGRCGADEGFGMGETVVPDRVDTDLLRPLVRMRVHRADGPNSMWLPLFSGDSSGRWGRLLARSGKIRT